MSLKGSQTRPEGTSTRSPRVRSIDVAREAGVSQATVSYVLNNDPRQSIPEETRARVLEAARKLDYQPYAPARMLRSGRSKLVLVIWQEAVIEAAISDLVEQMTAAVAKLGYGLIWHIGFHAGQELLSAHLAPAVVVALVESEDRETRAALQSFQAPLITVANTEWKTAGTRAQMEYLLRQGHKTIIYADSEKPQLERFTRCRREMAIQVCREQGLPDPRVVVMPQNRGEARQIWQDVLAVQPPPFAVCAYNDEVAMVVLAALADLQIRVPEQVAVIGQDNTRIAEMSNPPLTTIGVESPGISEYLIASIVNVIQGGPVAEAPTLQPEVIVRISA